MIEFPRQDRLVEPIKIYSYSNDPNLGILRRVADEMNQTPSLKWDSVGESLGRDQSGDSYVRVSPITQNMKSSYGYFWCVGVAGFGRHLGVEKSFLSHGQDDVPRQRKYVQEAVKRLLDMCGDTSDFVIFGGQNNLVDANYASRTRNHSLEVRAELEQMIIDETKGIRALVIPPDASDNHLTDLMGKSVLVDTPTRSVHVFERLSFHESAQMAPYQIPEFRARRG